MTSEEIKMAVSKKHRVEIFFDKSKPNPKGFIAEVIEGPPKCGDEYRVQVTEAGRGYKIGDTIIRRSYELERDW